MTTSTGSVGGGGSGGPVTGGGGGGGVDVVIVSTVVTGMVELELDSLHAIKDSTRTVHINLNIYISYYYHSDVYL